MKATKIKDQRVTKRKALKLSLGAFLSFIALEVEHCIEPIKPSMRGSSQTAWPAGY